MRTYAYSPIKSSVFPWDEDPIDCLKLVTDNPKMSPSVYPMKPLWKSHDCDQKTPKTSHEFHQQKHH